MSAELESLMSELNTSRKEAGAEDAETLLSAIKRLKSSLELERAKVESLMDALDKIANMPGKYAVKIAKEAIAKQKSS